MKKNLKNHMIFPRQLPTPSGSNQLDEPLVPLPQLPVATPGGLEQKLLIRKSKHGKIGIPNLYSYNAKGVGLITLVASWKWSDIPLFTDYRG